MGNGDGTNLGKAFKPLLEQHPAHSGVHLLSNGRDAFVGRAVSARLADSFNLDEVLRKMQESGTK